MEKRIKNTQKSNLKAELKDFGAAMLYIALLMVYTVIMYTLQWIFAPFYIAEVFMDWKWKYKDLPNNSIRKRLVKLLYAIYCQRIYTEEP